MRKVGILVFYQEEKKYQMVIRTLIMIQEDHGRQLLCLLNQEAKVYCTK